ncbi:MAG TPA: PqqD family protein [Gemmatimonadaceae bacterium]|nr:PqqD family protein [Gemmatimonadaceae bacterium]
MLSADGPFAPKGDLIETRLADEMILLDPTTAQMFSLAGTGLLLWEALQSGTIADAAVQLTVQYDVPLDVATNDVHAFADRLLDAGLLHR